ncbi:MAG: FAD-dependent monooxygenase [Parvibaculum sp.]
MAGRSDKADIVIVGAGPVGLTLALVLAHQGVCSTLIEMRPEDAPAHPKCNTVSARSMEIFRRFGIAGEIRKMGLPADHPCDVVYATRYTRNELGRLPIPSWSERFGSKGHDAGWPTDEPPHRVSQLFLEPVLRRKAASTPGIDIRYDTELLTLERAGDAVILHMRDVKSGVEGTVEARYIIGCDGGRSQVRREIGVTLQGDDDLGRIKSVFLRSKELKWKETLSPAWMTWVINAEQPGTVVALDGGELFLCHCRVPAGVSFDEFDAAQGVRDVMGTDFEFEMLAAENWTARRLVAETYRKGRVFLAGDAAHIWLPMGGFGMNAGIEDADDLGWRLAGVVQGWAPESLLDSYETERRPVGDQVSRAALQFAQTQQSVEIPEAMEADTEEGRQLRELVGTVMVERDGAQFNPVGLNFGIPYEASPVIAYDGSVPPVFAIDAYEPSTVPGCRAPYVKLADGSSLYDRLHKGFTLLRLDPSLDVTAMEEVVAKRGVPFAVLDISGKEVRALYDFPLALVRPDQRIAWRGKVVPDACVELIDKLRGAA